MRRLRLHKPEAQFRHRIIQAALLFGGKVTLRLFLEHGQQIDIVTAQLKIRLALFPERQQPKVQFSLQPQRVNKEIEIGRWQLRARVFHVVGVRQQLLVCFTHAIQFTPLDFRAPRARHLNLRRESASLSLQCYARSMDPAATPESPESAGPKLQRLVEIMARLRAPDGCPWDREQNFDTIRKYTVEETYEVLDAIDRRDWADLREELGDYILQAVFYAQMASEEKHFVLGDCLDAINEKLIRRHPHIFGEETAHTGDEVLKLWDAVKAEEKRGKSETPAGLLDGIPRSQPALLEAQQISSRAARSGFDWPHIDDVLAKLQEEIGEFRTAHAAASRDQMEDELGDILFTIVNLARFAKVDPEQALRHTNAKFRQRFTHVERRLSATGEAVSGTPIDRLESLWQEAKL